MRQLILGVMAAATLAACTTEPAPAPGLVQRLTDAPASQWDLGMLRLELALQKAADGAAFGQPQPTLFVYQQPESQRLILSANIFGRQHDHMETARQECSLVVTRVRQLLGVSGDLGEPFEASGSALYSYFQGEQTGEVLAAELDAMTDIRVSVFAGDSATLLTCAAPLLRGEVSFDQAVAR